MFTFRELTEYIHGQSERSADRLDNLLRCWTRAVICELVADIIARAGGPLVPGGLFFSTDRLFEVQAIAKRVSHRDRRNLVRRTDVDSSRVRTLGIPLLGERIVLARSDPPAAGFRNSLPHKKSS